MTSTAGSKVRRIFLKEMMMSQSCLAECAVGKPGMEGIHQSYKADQEEGTFSRIFGQLVTEPEPPFANPFLYQIFTKNILDARHNGRQIRKRDQ